MIVVADGTLLPAIVITPDGRCLTFRRRERTVN